METLQLNYKTFGQGDPIIILHGMLGMLDNWQTFAKLLAKDHEVFIVDLRNHGRSPHHDQMNYQVMAEDVLDFLNDQWLHQDVTILGHSMGGKVAMQLAFDHPERISTLMVADIAPRVNPRIHDHIFELLQTLPLEKLDSRATIQSYLMDDLNDAGLTSFLMKNLSRNGQYYQWKPNLASIIKNYDRILAAPTGEYPSYEGPTYFFRGEHSEYIQDGDLSTIKQQFPAAEVILIPNAGHWVHIDNREFLLEKVRMV